MASRKLLGEPIKLSDDDGLTTGVTCEDSFEVSNLKYPQYTYLREFEVSYSYGAYFADGLPTDFDQLAALKEIDGIVLATLGIKSGLIAPSMEVSNIDCNSRLRQSLGSMSGVLDILNDHVVNRNPYQDNTPGARSFDAFDEGWVDILGVKASVSQSMEDTIRECPADSDIDFTKDCHPIIASIIVQVPAEKSITGFTIETQILREIKRAISNDELTTTSIPAIKFIATLTPDTGGIMPGEQGPGPSKITVIETAQKRFTALGATYLGLFIVLLVVALVLAYMKFREYHQGSNKLKTATSIQHYPITGDSSETPDDNINEQIPNNVSSMRSADSRASAQSRVSAQSRASNKVRILEERTNEYESTWKSMLIPSITASDEGTTLEFINTERTTSREKYDRNINAVEMMADSNERGAVPINLTVDEESDGKPL